MLPVLLLEIDRLECIWLLRKLRAVREQMLLDKLALEERIRSKHNGHNEEAHRAVDADLMIADRFIAKLWKVCGS